MGNQVARHAHRTKIDSTIDPNERNDRWLTPKHIVEALGPFESTVESIFVLHACLAI